MHHVRTDVSEESIASIIRVEEIPSFEAYVLTRATRLSTPEDGMLHSHSR
jgi:hypothetical protein